jgi:hypothetical protein
MMRRDYDKVDASFSCQVYNFLARHAVTELGIAICVLVGYFFGDRIQSVLEIQPVL